MCGIVGYVGHREAYPYLIEGLHKLEYRGYDSAGIALHSQQALLISKTAGKVAALEELIKSTDLSSTTGIGHTRWATHGVPSDYNAHPHSSQSGKLALVHNGIIENYASIKEELLKKGYVFKSETDSEVLLNFIEDIKINNDCPLEEAIRIALKRITGAYVILVLDQDTPDTIIAARKGSPLVIGIGQGEHFLGSDASPMLGHTKEVVYINDYELAIIRPDELILKNLGNEQVTPFIQQLDMELASIEKAGYPHFMLKEIVEQPKAIKDCLRGRVDADTHQITLSGLERVKDQLLSAHRIIIVACGTSWHAALLAEYWIEELCRIPVEVEYASEFRYRNPIIDKEDVIIAISQSGETADTLVALENAKQQGATIFGIVNVVGSSIARLSDSGIYTHAGPEIGVASTKAFTTQLVALLLFAIKLAKYKQKIAPEQAELLVRELQLIPEKTQEILDTQIETIKAIAHKYANARDFLYLGRGYNFPIALEGALKLKEISYIHAEGYPAAEMKHGPIALVDENLPVLFIATKDKIHEKIISNMQEIKARSGQLISLVSRDDKLASSLSDDVIEIPEAHEIVAPILSTIPLQLLAYYIGIARGCDVDKPRNLAKSVTVE
ncbi:glucosamine--fructose-6-phosphate aminotransferase (isomerizing) [Sphingobacterium nematocida]|uniref:Glutamine--fructose-6-phosphate aminotransferase [isomerizing] n=1 Tax=Sphingobacterium nematocida TaxID=1513896 RepID=A0A1T5CKQ6_9SPHI|nr:glutamine--fructose-6-phosphate transaminase (isomerizing) [Sphingobacterium nematocida]SKB59926.1 glucosamine--fructose-6-phosphate aminotransferase (isomerizing) [Sphingobacterium nematocida]